MQGPSEVGACLVIVNAPVGRSGDVNEVFAAFDADYPGAILTDFKG